MSAWLVDTHALLWFLTDDPQLSEPARATMESGESVLLVSSASIWEIAIKRGLGKVRAPTDLLTLLRREGVESLAIEPEHAWAVQDLASGDHKDPFDRLLAAQAQFENLPLISNDPQLDRYGIKRLW